MGRTWCTGGSTWTWGKTLLRKWSCSGTGCPGRLWSLPPWRCSGSLWTQLRAPGWPRWPWGCPRVSPGEGAVPLRERRRSRGQRCFLTLRDWAGAGRCHFGSEIIGFCNCLGPCSYRFEELLSSWVLKVKAKQFGATVILDVSHDSWLFGKSAWSLAPQDLIWMESEACERAGNPCTSWQSVGCEKAEVVILFQMYPGTPPDISLPFMSRITKCLLCKFQTGTFCVHILICS